MHASGFRSSLRRAAAALLSLALLAGCKDSTGPRPVPVAASLSPDAATAGSAGISITVTGSEFRRGSEVRWNGAALATTYVSATSLTAAVPDSLLRAGGAASITVHTPQPGGGTSAALTFTVRNPVPAISSLSTDTSRVGRSNVPLAITGSGFVPSSQVSWNGTLRPTTYVSPTQLSLAIPASDLGVGGVVQVTVVNPQPGGGSSGAAQFTVLNAVPEITQLPVQGGTAGRCCFTLTLHGTGFVEGAVVRWNGVERPATVTHSTRIEVEVLPGDVATPRTVALAVVNPLSGGIPSSTATFTVHPLGGATGTVTRANLTARDLAWDPGTARLYLSIPAANNPANTVTAVDPATRMITGSIAVGNEPGVLARSGDGQYLYVGLNGSSSVRRIDLASFTAGPEWSLGAGMRTHDMEVIPGQPGSLAVVRSNPGFHSVVVYDDGVARPQAVEQAHTVNDVAFAGPASTLYGKNTSTSGFNLYRIGITSAGVSVLQDTRGLMPSFAAWNVVGAAGRLYANSGHVVDADRAEGVGQFPLTQASAVAVDPALGRAYFVTGFGIDVYDMNTFQRLGHVPVANVQPAPAYWRLVRFGPDGLAFLSGPQLVLVRSPLFAP